MKIAALVLLLLLNSCSNENISADLILGFKSHLTFNQVTNELKRKGIKWDVLEKSTLSKTDSRPQFDIVEIRVPDLASGIDGGVFLSFYNNKLMRIWFYVNSLEKAKRILAANNDSRMDIELGKEIMVNPNTKLYIGKEKDGLILVTCENVVLAESKWEWIKTYGMNKPKVQRGVIV